MKSIAITCASGALLLVHALHSPAGAHVTLETAQASANSTYKAVLRVPHGCDGEATRALGVEIPEGFVAVKPMPKPGWTITTRSGPYDGTHNYHGRTLADGVREISWAGGPLPDEFYDEFIFRGHVADLRPGTRLHFKTTQTCAKGEIGWTEIAEGDQDPASLARPAPALLIMAGQETSGQHAGHHAGGLQQGPGSASLGPITVEDAHARPSLGRAPNSAVYMTLRTDGEPDRLVKVDSPVAKAVELHVSEMDARGVMTMRPVDAVPVEPGTVTTMKPGGIHVMLVGLVQPLEEGSTIPLTLTFEKAGELTFEIPVGATAGAGTDDHGHKH